MQTILCVKCNASFLIDETGLSLDVTSITCPNCTERISIEGYPFRTIIISKNEDAEAAFTKANRFYSKGNFANAQHFIKIAIELVPHNLDYQKLSSEIKKAFEDQNKVEQLRLKAIDLFEKGDLSGALNTVDEAIKTSNDSRFLVLQDNINRILHQKDALDTIFAKSAESFQRSEFPQGLDYIDQAIRIFPENLNYQELKRKLKAGLASELFNIASQKYSNKDIKGSLKLLDECLTLSPDEPKYISLHSKILRTKHKRKNLKIIFFTIFIIVLVAPSIIAILRFQKNNSEKKEWSQVLRANSIPTYRYYIQKYPEGLYRTLAQNKIDSLTNVEERTWEQVQKIDEINEYLKFMQTYPSSKHNQELIGRIRSIQEQPYQKWYGTYYPENPDMYCEDNYELKLRKEQLGFVCEFFIPQGSIVAGNAVLSKSGSEVIISPLKKEQIHTASYYQSSTQISKDSLLHLFCLYFHVTDVTKPAIILTDSSGKLLTSFPQYEYASYRQPQALLARKKPSLKTNYDFQRADYLAEQKKNREMQRRDAELEKQVYDASAKVAKKICNRLFFNNDINEVYSVMKFYPSDNPTVGAMVLTRTLHGIACTFYFSYKINYHRIGLSFKTSTCGASLFLGTINYDETNDVIKVSSDDGGVATFK